MRFARLLVSEIKLYYGKDVETGRTNRDLYSRLKDPIERSRELYVDRVASPIRDSTTYFDEELVRTLADGDPGVMGSPG